MSTESRQIILDNINELCRGCTPALLAVGNAIEMFESGEPVNLEEVGQKLGECVLGTSIVGSCSTKKTICQHPAVTDSMKTSEQVSLLTSYIL